MTNLQRVRKAMETAGIDAMFLSDINSVQWASGFTGSSGFLLITPSDGVFITDSRYAIQAGDQVKELPSAIYSTGKGTMLDLFAETAERLGAKKVGFESNAVTYSTHSGWSKKLSGVELVPVDELVGPLRAVKSPEEVAIIRRACALADKCLEHVQRMIQVGVTEFDIGLEIEFFFRRQGADIAFEPIVVSGLRSARPHGRASEKKLESGDFLTLDLGCRIDGYCSDITRTFVVGSATDRHREIYDQVLKSQLAAIAAMKPGASGKDVDKISRDVLAEKNLDGYFGHGLGHGLGRLVHDSGSLSTRSETILAPGMVLTVEPGVYIEGFGGVRIEDDVLVTEGEPEILTHFPKEMMVLP